MEPGLRSTPAGSSRKRARENETESQRLKREKAAERQRRKRERDRHNSAAAAAAAAAASAAAGIPGLIGFSPNDTHHHHLLQPPSSQPLSASGIEYQNNPDGLTPEEVARRDRIRAAARERQRKHRMMVKQRKLRELGLDMGNEMMTGSMDDAQYRYSSDGQYQQVLPHELQGHSSGPPQMQEPQFGQSGPSAGPPAPGLGGQTFASTLLLSFSCAPLLKQHLLRTLHMSNEELASLEPILAEAWERWDHARRAHYAEQAAKAGIPYPPVVAVDPSLTGEGPSQLAAALQTAGTANASSNSAVGDSPQQTNEFRERFQRSLVTPAPFRSSFGNGEDGSHDNAAGGDSSSTPSSASVSSTTTNGEVLDPQLAAVSSSASGVCVKSEAVAPANGASAVPSVSAAPSKKGHLETRKRV